PSPLLSSDPQPEVICRLTAVSDGLSTSLALASNWACVIRRGPLSSAIAASVTGVVTGASLTAVMLMATEAGAVGAVAVTRGKRVAGNGIENRLARRQLAAAHPKRHRQRVAVGIRHLRQQ